jgi:hypothetical protein
MPESGVGFVSNDLPRESQISRFAWRDDTDGEVWQTQLKRGRVRYEAHVLGVVGVAGGVGVVDVVVVVELL